MFKDYRSLLVNKNIHRAHKIYSTINWERGDVVINTKDNITLNSSYTKRVKIYSFYLS